jgi:hypothetical protein
MAPQSSKTSGPGRRRISLCGKSLGSFGAPWLFNFIQRNVCTRSNTRDDPYKADRLARFGGGPGAVSTCRAGRRCPALWTQRGTSVHLQDATSMTGSFVLLVGNGRFSQTINHYLEARANGRRCSRLLKPSAINFPLQVHWVDRRHRTHQSFEGSWVPEFPTRSQDDVCPGAKRAPGLQSWLRGAWHRGYRQ